MNTQTEVLQPGSRMLRGLGRLFADPVLRSLLAMLALLAVIDLSQVTVSIVFTLEALWEMLPFFALAIAIAGYAKASGADSLIADAFSGHPLRATVLAALVGAISPFCSCGVIPLIAAMLGAGVPLAPVMAFWIASPIMDPEMFVLTAAGIGFHFAVAKTLAAIAMGLLAGFGVLAIQRYGGLRDPLRVQPAGTCASSCDSSACASEKPAVQWRFWRQPARMALFAAEARAIGLFLGKWLTLAFFLESLMLAYVSSDWIVAYVGADNPLAIPLAALVGAPSYLVLGLAGSILTAWLYQLAGAPL